MVGAQAVALRVAGDRAAFYGCGFYGAQDTLNDDRGRHYYKECFIQGSIDFIFGNAKSLFQVYNYMFHMHAYRKRYVAKLHTNFVIM